MSATSRRQRRRRDRAFATVPLPPVLSYTKGEDNQASFHLAPVRPSDLRGGGVEKAYPFFTIPSDKQQEEGRYKRRRLYNLQPPKCFGRLAHVNRITYDPRYKQVYDDYVFARNPLSTGTIAHANLKRRDRCERAKYALVRHPDPRTVPSYDGSPLTPIEERVRDIAVNYPNIKGGIMKAPFYFRAEKFTLREAKQPAGFVRIFGTGEIGSMVIDYLMGGNEDLCNLFMTCQFMAQKLQYEWMHLDSRLGDFFKFDKYPVDEFRTRAEAARKEGDETKAKKLEDIMGCFSRRCIISPVREHNQGPLQRQFVSLNGTPLNSRVQEGVETPWTFSMATHYKLLHLVNNNGKLLTDLVLFAQPWLTVKALEFIIPEMPKLRTIGIHNCFLMNFGNTQELLQAINKLNDKRKESGNPHVTVDFTPFYFKGPGWKLKKGGRSHQGHVGEYGLVPEENTWIRTDNVLGAQLFAIEDLCHKGGQDFFSVGTGFRSFLDRLPLRPYQLHSILDSIARIRDLNEKKHYFQVSKLVNRNRSGVQYIPGQDKPDISPEMLHAMQITVYSSFMVACNGTAMKQKEVDDLLTLKGRFQLERCAYCNMHLPAFFFLEHQLRLNADYVMCHGCELGDFLQQTCYRFYNYRRAAVEAIYSDKPDLASILTSIPLTSNAQRPGFLPKREEWPPRGVKFSGRGSMDAVCWIKVRRLWSILTRLDLMAANKVLARRFGLTEASLHGTEDGTVDVDLADRISEYKKCIEERRLQQDFVKGISQRNRHGGLSTEHRTCRSWEHVLKEYRAAAALDQGSGYTTHNVAIRFGKNGITSFAAMAGHHGEASFDPEGQIREASYEHEDEWGTEYGNGRDEPDFDPGAPVMEANYENEDGWQKVYLHSKDGHHNDRNGTDTPAVAAVPSSPQDADMAPSATVQPTPDDAAAKKRNHNRMRNQARRERKRRAAQTKSEASQSTDPQSTPHTQGKPSDGGAIKEASDTQPGDINGRSVNASLGQQDNHASTNTRGRRRGKSMSSKKSGSKADSTTTQKNGKKAKPAVSPPHLKSQDETTAVDSSQSTQPQSSQPKNEQEKKRCSKADSTTTQKNGKKAKPAGSPPHLKSQDETNAVGSSQSTQPQSSQPKNEQEGEKDGNGDVESRFVPRNTNKSSKRGSRRGRWVSHPAPSTAHTEVQS
ncbi:hypothetical protein F5Y17DRAFT_455102 [Xylariaceae sp. FL0594]|nr:hypothetical protein F5Y17DRAFT_455102 [Xylariaceae sp. FL0594]